MTEVPEHLLKRAQAAKEKAASKPAEEAAPAADAGAGDAPAAESDSRIPAHLLERSKAAKAKKAGGAADEARRAGGGVATAVAPVAAAGGTVATAAGPPLAAGPGGHTQRLLTVVKSGSIQDVKAKPQDKVHVWPHLLVVEFVAALACTAFVLIFSWLVNAPLLELANFNQTPNPSKAPWYFLGLQELLTMFHPMVAGVTIPGMGIFVLHPLALHRQEPVEQARGSQVRDLADDRLPDVLGGARRSSARSSVAPASTSRSRGSTGSSSSCEVNEQ